MALSSDCTLRDSAAMLSRKSQRTDSSVSEPSSSSTAWSDPEGFAGIASGLRDPPRHVVVVTARDRFAAAGQRCRWDGPFGGLGRRSTWRRTSSGGTALKIPSGGHSDRFKGTCACQSRIPGGVDGGVRGAWLYVTPGGVHGRHAVPAPDGVGIEAIPLDARLTCACR